MKLRAGLISISPAAFYVTEAKRVPAWDLHWGVWLAKHSKDHASGPTHAIEELNEAGVPFVVHEYEHDPSARAYGEETVEKLGIDPAIAFKTLMVKLEPTGEFVVGCVPALAHLSMKLIAKAVRGEECCDG